MVAVLFRTVLVCGLWGNGHEITNYLRHFRLKSGWQWLRCRFFESVIVRHTHKRDKQLSGQNRKTYENKAVGRSCEAIRSHVSGGEDLVVREAESRWRQERTSWTTAPGRWVSLVSKELTIRGADESSRCPTSMTTVFWMIFKFSKDRICLKLFKILKINSHKLRKLEYISFPWRLKYPKNRNKTSDLASLLRGFRKAVLLFQDWTASEDKEKWERQKRSKVVCQLKQTWKPNLNFRKSSHNKRSKISTPYCPKGNIIGIPEGHKPITFKMISRI